MLASTTLSLSVQPALHSDLTPMLLKPSGIAAVSLTHSLGVGVADLWNAMINHRSGLRPNDLEWCDLDCWIGRHPDVERFSIPKHLTKYECRNHRLVWSALQDPLLQNALDAEYSKYGTDRVALVMGTSTSGIQSTETAYAERIATGQWPASFNFNDTHSVESLCQFVSDAVGLTGPSIGIASACASSAKVFLIAQKWLATGVADAVLVGGADSLCLSTLHGFNALQLLSDTACRPFDRRRNGISIGEAAGFALLTREDSDVIFLGGGESSDAHHITTPDPEGSGAINAINQALKHAGITANDIDYINAHGTATQSNDRAEAIALKHVFGNQDTPVSSTKGATGHTLGAAGITEAVVTIEALRRQVLPPFTELGQTDDDIDLNFVTKAVPARIRRAMTNNFGFGGTNCSLIFGQGV